MNSFYSIILGVLAQATVSDPSVNYIELRVPVGGWHQYERPPEYPGGMKALSDFLRQHLLYPNEAKKANVQGRVFVSFVIDTLGQVGQIRVIKGLGYGCDEEAIRVMEQMPCWIPGELNGRKVQVKYNLPIMFPQDR